MTIGPNLEEEALRYFLLEAEELAAAHSPPPWAEVQRVLREGCAVVRTQAEALTYTIARWQYYGDKNRAEIAGLKEEMKILASACDMTDPCRPDGEDSVNRKNIESFPVEEVTVVHCGDSVLDYNGYGFRFVDKL